MGLGIAIAACIPAYVAGIAALAFGMGWFAALGVLTATGIGAVGLLALAVVARRALADRGKPDLGYSLR